MFLGLINGHYFGAWYNTLIGTVNDMVLEEGDSVRSHCALDKWGHSMMKFEIAGTSESLEFLDFQNLFEIWNLFG